MPSTHQAPAAAGHAHDVDIKTALDFMNTLDLDDGFLVEKLPTLDLVLDWFEDRKLIHMEGSELAKRQAAAHPRVAEKDLARVRAVRGALRQVADAVVEDRVPPKTAVGEVNRALHARQVIELVATDDGLHVDHRHVGDPIDDALARLSEALVQEVINGQPDRIRICDNDQCRWVFYDTSRTARRRWCDMATCGNRAKQARHRARSKGGDTAAPAI